ncbi:isocitrate lyase/phosphoenolpyruvate mutase family protein [Longispora sp. K20-0274]|uniref:isocitrate lyase/PEP mutase family protein n=1 Tax=Longispora sp. K20-0274 TaxID=3088255 RepID=UPI00399A2D95
MTNSQLDRARTLHALHRSGRVLALPNAWDVASARVVEDAGSQAVATTSAGVAWSLGFPDGDHLAVDRALDLVARIVAAVNVPVTADIEGGYGDVAGTITGVVAAGAVGVNLEDGGTPQPERYATARRAAGATGVPLFLNARIDTYLFGNPDFDETVNRAQAYLAAGADGIFVPGVADPEVIAALVKAIPAPVNVLVGPGSPTVDELGALGVARASLGSSIAQSAYGLARRAAAEFLSTGGYSALTEAEDYGRLNGLLSPAQDN